MKRLLYIFLFCGSISFCQNNENQRLLALQNQIENLSIDNIGFNETLKTEINISNITLANFLLAISEVHNININIAPELNQMSIIARNFSNVTIADLLIYLCKEYQLTIDFTGNILTIKKYKTEVQQPIERIIPITYNPNLNTISIDAKSDKLYDLCKRISDETGKRLVYESGLDNKAITFYVRDTPIDAALDKLAFANDLLLKITKDGFYSFEDIGVQVTSNEQASKSQPRQRTKRQRRGDFFFKIKDTLQKTLEISLDNVPVETVVMDIGNALNLNIYTAKPLTEAGYVTFKTKHITYDHLLNKIFEMQEMPNLSIGSNQSNASQNINPREPHSSSEIFTFKKEGNTYFFGTERQLSLRKVDIIKLENRSVRLLNDPTGSSNSYSRNQFSGNSLSTLNGNQFDNFGNRPREQVNTRSNTNFSNYNNQVEALVNILPEELKYDLDIQVDYELNSFYVNGPASKVQRFKRFIKRIDKPVPVVLIEVMIIEISKSATIDAGVSWGIGTEPTTTQGALYPETDLTLGAGTVNKIIGSFNDFAGFNLGRVGPNFFASIKASETNGDLKVRSTPKLATLNSHKAIFSNSQTSFYAVTQRNIYGTDNPQTSELTNYFPIDAELSLTITPSVTGNGKVILDVGVIQSSFGNRVADDAPPDINSRSFSSIIAMQNQDIAILGGIEEQLKSNRGSGVPFLARIPLLKWLFSRRVREGRKSKLTVLIKPTIVY